MRHSWCRCAENALNSHPVDYYWNMITDSDLWKNILSIATVCGILSAVLVNYLMYWEDGHFIPFDISLEYFPYTRKCHHLLSVDEIFSSSSDVPQVNNIHFLGKWWSNQNFIWFWSLMIDVMSWHLLFCIISIFGYYYRDWSYCCIPIFVLLTPLYR